MMCFYNDDYDWVATVNEKSFVRCDAPGHCIECGRGISAGEWRANIYQQEHDECQYCEDDCSDEYDEELERETCQHNYGETYSATICRECCLILAAIYDLEEKEGCPAHARQPAPGELHTELHEDREHKYIRHAIEMFPELTTNVLCEME